MYIASVIAATVGFVADLWTSSTPWTVGVMIVGWIGGYSFNTIVSLRHPTSVQASELVRQQIEVVRAETEKLKRLTESGE